ncbi:MAG: MerR family transcriptional regulator [Desulfobacteraceae bacterium]|nr:MerR family transcriptional regulator [Desulfobacteraceae bacterium]
MTDHNDIPDKLYFKIGEVSEIAGVPAYVLRFWESEFPKIRPKRTASGQRLYRRRDIEMILTIRYLLHEKKFTIRGAKQHLKNKRAEKPETLPRDSAAMVAEIRGELQALRKLVE